MNSRIKELAEQAFQPLNEVTTEGVADRYTFEQTWFQMYNQKLTELIVRECLMKVIGAKIRNESYAELIERIKEDFGVQE